MPNNNSLDGVSSALARRGALHVRKDSVVLVPLAVAGSHPVVALSIDGQRDVLVASVLGLRRFDADALPGAAALACRLNNQLLMGNFRLDMDDGELGFFLAVPAGRRDGPSDTASRVVGVCRWSVERFLDDFDRFCARAGGSRDGGDSVPPISTEDLRRLMGDDGEVE